MDTTNLSGHSNGAKTGGQRVRYQWLYTLALKVCRPKSHLPDPLAGKLLLQIAATVLCKRICQPSLWALGQMHGRSGRSIRRSIAALQAAGLIDVIQRGKKLSNVYRLARWLWARLTGRDLRRTPPRPGMARLGDELEGVIAAARAKWAAAQGEAALARR
jgi:hypothetical protein